MYNYQHIDDFKGFHVGKYTVRPMDPSWDSSCRVRSPRWQVPSHWVASAASFDPSLDSRVPSFQRNLLKSMGNPWKSIGNLWKLIEIYGKSMEIRGKSMEIKGSLWKPIGNLWKSIWNPWQIHGKSMGNLWTSMGNLWETYGKSMGNLWEIYVWKSIGNPCEIYGNLVWKNDQIQADKRGERPSPKNLRSFFLSRLKMRTTKTKRQGTMRVPTSQVRYQHG